MLEHFFKHFYKKIQGINNSIAINSVNTMATMWCVYSFAILSLWPLFFPESISIVQYISGAIIQLISLPLIMVGQDLLGKTTETRAIKDHHTIQKSFAELKLMHEDLHTTVKELKELHTELHAKIEGK